MIYHSEFWCESVYGRYFLSLYKAHSNYTHKLNKIVNATLLFLPPFFMSWSWTQRSKTFSMYTKGLFLSKIVHKLV